MSESKALVILISFCVFGLIFMAAGMYFLSEKYLGALKNASGSEEKAKAAVKSGRTCGYVSLGLGGFTVFCGIFAKLMPGIFSYLALAYVIVLIIAFVIITCTIKNKK